MQVLPRFDSADMVELFHLRSYPTQLIVSSVGSFLVQTSGIALRSTTTRKLVVLEYRPANYSACFLPVVVQRPNNKSTLHWDKRSVLSYRTELDKKYWQQSTFLGRINGVVYENYVKWVEEYISRDKIFVPQSICSSAEEISCFIRAETWETFLTDSLETFANLAVQMNAIIPPRAKEMHLLSNTEPVRFALSDGRTDPEQYASIGDGGIVPSGNAGSSSGVEPLEGIAGSSGGGRDDRFEDVSAPGGSGRGRRAARGRKLMQNTTAGANGGVPTAAAVTTATAAAATLPTAVIKNNTLGVISSITRSNGTEIVTAGSSNTSAPTPSPTANSSLATSITGSAKAEEMAVATNMTEWQMAEYYASLMVCMQEYTLEDFTSALGSCLTERIGYIHIDGDEYYRISPRFPFALMQEYQQPIPSARLIEVESAGVSDFVISLVLLTAALLGVLAGLWRLNLFDWCWSQGALIKRRRVGAAAPAEGGYSKASELPVYTSWSMGHGSDRDSGASRTPEPGPSPPTSGGRTPRVFFSPSPYAPASFLKSGTAGVGEADGADAEVEAEGDGRYSSIINMEVTRLLPAHER